MDEVSMFTCDRCGKDAARVTINSFGEFKVDKLNIDWCYPCTLTAVGLLLKRLPKEDVKKWIAQFNSGIM